MRTCVWGCKDYGAATAVSTARKVRYEAYGVQMGLRGREDDDGEPVHDHEGHERDQKDDREGFSLAGPTGLEPGTSGVTGRGSRVSRDKALYTLQIKPFRYSDLRAFRVTLCGTLCGL
jgi:hypothetical protein